MTEQQTGAYPLLGGEQPITPELSPHHNNGHAVHYSSVTNEWTTPDEFFAPLDAEFRFDLDPCATSENAKCARFFTQEIDGLTQPWNATAVFMNPPYGRDLGAWVRKAHREVQAGRAGVVVCLIPARTDTGYWHDCVMRAAEVRLVRRRITFGGSIRHGRDRAAAAPFPSAVVVMRRHTQTAPVFSTINARQEAA